MLRQQAVDYIEMIRTKLALTIFFLTLFISYLTSVKKFTVLLAALAYEWGQRLSDDSTTITTDYPASRTLNRHDPSENCLRLTISATCRSLDVLVTVTQLATDAFVATV